MSQLAQYSKVPELHALLQQIPYPISWSEVITDYPSLSHCYWSLLFALFTSLIQLITYLISKPFVRRLIGYTKYPPLPSNSKVSNSCYYLKLGQYVKYRRHIKIERYDIHKLNEKYCDSKLSVSEITEWFVKCNEFHAINRLQRKKFREYLFPILVKSMCLSFGINAFYDKEWLYHRNLFYAGWPHKQQLDCCIPDIKVLYLFHIGYYMYRTFSAIFIERRLKDFIPTIIHHLVSLVLLVLSYIHGFVRVGVVIILLHDPADIILQSAKFFKLIQIEILCNFFFALLCVMWLSTRVIIYPYHCVLSAFIDLPAAIEENTSDVEYGRYAGYMATVLMCVLYCLHLHWFKLLIEAVIRIIRGKQLRDGRSDSEMTESDTDHDRTNTQ